MPHRNGRAIRNGDTVLASDRPTEWDIGGSSPTCGRIEAHFGPLSQRATLPSGERDLLDGGVCWKRESTKCLDKNGLWGL
jgi:hypothetical protein